MLLLKERYQSSLYILPVGKAFLGIKNYSLIPFSDIVIQTRSFSGYLVLVLNRTSSVTFPADVTDFLQKPTFSGEMSSFKQKQLSSSITIFIDPDKGKSLAQEFRLPFWASPFVLDNILWSRFVFSSQPLLYEFSHHCAQISFIILLACLTAGLSDPDFLLTPTPS